LTSNGKIDKKALPSPEGLGLSTGVEYVAPRNELEEQLVEIWKEVLKVEKVGIDDNFFDLGGNSMKLVTLSKRVNEMMNDKIPLVKLFATPSIKALALFIKDRSYTEQIDEKFREQAVDEFNSGLGLFNNDLND
jgi:acyl carrier protein